ncbi:zonular occludens toxin domain-containing protein [Methylobacter sp.]|uniref:zonular occludens toxin domain-containing protein n=1 Tax=Methylobacter sp. TaxID=2051955 RepID=UPI003DA2509B
MITLITGGPGTGKSAWTVQELLRLPDIRPVYVHGIPDLKIPHTPIYCHSELCDLCRSNPFLIEHENNVKDSQIEEGYSHIKYVEDWPQWAVKGALLVIDEVQRIWRPTNSASSLPEGIARLETHRHYGLDFWLISQGPHLFHGNIRKLVGRHIHLVSSWRGRTEYEFPECRENTASRSDAVSRPYSLPKKVFNLYKSAEIHTKQKHRLPMAVYAFALALMVVFWLGYKAYSRIAGQTQEVKETMKPIENSSKTIGTDGSGTVANVPINSAKKVYPDFKPTVAGVPASAPAYADLVKVTSVPHLVGCVNTPETGCRCYSKQAVPVNVSYRYCTDYLAGKVFNPFKEPVNIEPDNHYIKYQARDQVAVNSQN